MADDSYEAFLRYLFEERVDPRLCNVHDSSRRRRLQREDEFAWALGELRDAHRLLTFIGRSGLTEAEIYETFRAPALATVIRRARSGLREHNRAGRMSGVSEVMDEHFVDLAAGMEVEHLPDNEAGVLHGLGFPEVGDHLEAITFEVRTFAQRHDREIQERGVSRQLDEAVERMDHVGNEHAAMEQIDATKPTPPRRSRKWWTGLGKIVAGAGTSLINIGLGAGLIPGLAPDARAAMLSSATLGIGAALEGVGAIRGE